MRSRRAEIQLWGHIGKTAERVMVGALRARGMRVWIVLFYHTDDM
jgi:hypothetical protein